MLFIAFHTQKKKQKISGYGVYIGIGGVLTFKKAAKIREVVEYVPIDRILLETDCPYLAPEPFRGKRNSSLYIPEVVKKIAEIKQLDYDEVIDITFKMAGGCMGYERKRIIKEIMAIFLMVALVLIGLGTYFW